MNSNCCHCSQEFTCGIIYGQKICWCNRTNINLTVKNCLCPKCIKLDFSKFIIKKKTWRFLVAYNGTRYHGWQCQGKLPTIELELKKALLRITGQKISLTVAGRTDSGVHASGQVVSCTFSSRFYAEKLILAFNAVLPLDIAIWRIDEMPQSFNAKLQNIGKRYIYRINTSLVRNVFLNDQTWHICKKINLKKMKEAAKYFIGEHDFHSFRSINCDSFNAYRYLWLLNIKKKSSIIEIDIRGNAFCYNMIRIIVGTLIKIGLNKLVPNEIKNILKSKNRQLAGETAPAKGLTIEEVYYPDLMKNTLLPSNAKFPRYPVTLKTWGYDNSQIKIGQV